MNESALYLVYPERSEAGTLESLPDTEGLILLKEDQFMKDVEYITDEQKICITSEATLNSILMRFRNAEKKQAVQSMKDKYLFRELLEKEYPALQYRILDFDEIKHLKISDRKVLKPLKGCFGTAVKVVDTESDFAHISDEIRTEIDRNSAILSDGVLSNSEFILEDFIHGEEYAVDMFYDSFGKPHIMNIYYHPLPRYEEYLHMIYYTSKDIFDLIYDEAISFFEKLNKKLKIRNITLHSEFKYVDHLVPVEINAMRFGGMGLGNMVYHSMDVNPYRCFLNDESPDWDQIWNQHSQSNFVYFIAYNGSRIDTSMQQPNIPALENEFRNILNKTIFDYQKQLAFAVYTLDESLEDIDRLLEIDFNDYFEQIP